MTGLLTDLQEENDPISGRDQCNYSEGQGFLVCPKSIKSTSLLAILRQSNPPEKARNGVHVPYHICPCLQWPYGSAGQLLEASEKRVHLL